MEIQVIVVAMQVRPVEIQVNVVELHLSSVEIHVTIVEKQCRSNVTSKQCPAACLSCGVWIQTFLSE